VGRSSARRRGPPGTGVAKVGYDFTAAFEHGLDLILDALEKRRGMA
jgi:hypothetical protein